MIKSHVPSVQSPFTVVIFSAIGALGFGTLENFFYVFSESLSGKVLETVVSALERALLSVPLHTVTGASAFSLRLFLLVPEALIDFAMSGVLIGLALVELPTTPVQHPTFRNYLKATWLPMLIHGSFDVFALIGGGLGGWFQFIYIINAVILGGAAYKAYRGYQDAVKLPSYHPDAPTHGEFGALTLSEEANNSLV